MASIARRLAGGFPSRFNDGIIIMPLWKCPMVKVKMSKKLARALSVMIQNGSVDTVTDEQLAKDLTYKKHLKLQAELRELAVSLT